MARYRVIHWRDIPAAVEADDGETRVSRPLSPRFQELIDAVAMRTGAADSQEYLDAWEHGPETERPGSAAAVVEAVVAELEQQFEHLAARHLGRAP